MKYKIFMMVLVFVLALPFAAEARKAHGDKECKLETKANVSLNFNNQQVSLATVKDKMQKKTTEVEVIAKELGIEDLEVQSMNYNVNMNHNNYYNMSDCEGEKQNCQTFNFNGSVSYQLKSEEQANALMTALLDKGYQVNLNVNAYRRCR